MTTISKIDNCLILITIATIIIFLNMGCDDEVAVNCEGDQAQPVEQFYEGEYDMANCQFQNLEIKSGENNLVIKNQNDYEKFVTCNNGLPNIDFDKYFILAGVYSHHQCATFDTQSIVTCENKIIFRVRLTEQICQAAIPVNYFAVISKAYGNSEVEFDVRFY